jgi:tRNA threonylcarbamoyladenosine biosynthesis protein TsaB
VDAWRGDVFAALYENGVEVEPPSIEPPVQLLARYSEHTLFIGDAADIYRDVILATLGHAARIAEPAAPLLAGTIARLATESARGGHQPPPHAIRPLYVRRPDAELARHARPVG